MDAQQTQSLVALKFIFIILAGKCHVLPNLYSPQKKLDRKPMTALLLEDRLSQLENIVWMIDYIGLKSMACFHRRLLYHLLGIFVYAEWCHGLLVVSICSGIGLQDYQHGGGLGMWSGDTS